MARPIEWQPRPSFSSLILHPSFSPLAPRNSPLIRVSPGELIDKITILEIKSQRITDPDKLAHVHLELATLQDSCAQLGCPSEALHRLSAELRAVNEKLWDAEDAIRLCEQRQDFGSGFVELARSVYRLNDERAALKRMINGLFGAAFAEQKEYRTLW
jgi:hypothetical protein